MINNSDPNVSVLMSVLNAEPYIREAIESILSQTLSNFELIIIDDGSSDGTWSVIMEYSQKDSRIIPIHFQKNIGTSNALNAGLSKARGIYITRQDGDDISLPQRLEAQFNVLEKETNLGGIGVAAILISENGTPIKNGFTITDPVMIGRALLDYMCLCGPTVMVRRTVLESVGFYFTDDLSYTEDYDLCLRISEIAGLGNIETPLYLYRQHTESVSKRYIFRQLYNKAIALERAFQRRKPGVDSKEFIRLIGRDYLEASIVGWINGELIASRESLEKAVAYCPDLFSQEKQLEDILIRFIMMVSTEDAISVIENIFSRLFPVTAKLNRVKSRLLGKMHMRVVFYGLGQGRSNLVDEHLWLGVKADPVWVLNRGVLSLLWKRIFHRKQTPRIS